MADAGNPFQADGHWLKCALHAHSTESDGDLPPAALATQYAAVGFDVLSITDHWRLTLLPGCGWGTWRSAGTGSARCPATSAGNDLRLRYASVLFAGTVRQPARPATAQPGRSAGHRARARSPRARPR